MRVSRAWQMRVVLWVRRTIMRFDLPTAPSQRTHDPSKDTATERVELLYAWSPSHFLLASRTPTSSTRTPVAPSS